jgi:hypothetical protein
MEKSKVEWLEAVAKTMFSVYFNETHNKYPHGF